MYENPSNWVPFIAKRANGYVTAVATGQSQRFYSGVGIFNWYYLSSPPQIPRASRFDLELGGLIYMRIIYYQLYHISGVYIMCTVYIHYNIYIYIYTVYISHLYSSGPPGILYIFL